jgi:hypothetical protein
VVFSVLMKTRIAQDLAYFGMFKTICESLLITRAHPFI